MVKCSLSTTKYDFRLFMFPWWRTIQNKCAKIMNMIIWFQIFWHKIKIWISNMLKWPLCSFYSSFLYNVQRIIHSIFHVNFSWHYFTRNIKNKMAWKIFFVLLNSDITNKLEMKLKWHKWFVIVISLYKILSIT